MAEAFGGSNLNCPWGNFHRSAEKIFRVPSSAPLSCATNKRLGDITCYRLTTCAKINKRKVKTEMNKNKFFSIFSLIEKSFLVLRFSQFLSLKNLQEKKIYEREKALDIFENDVMDIYNLLFLYCGDYFSMKILYRGFCYSDLLASNPFSSTIFTQKN